MFDVEYDDFYDEYEETYTDYRVCDARDLYHTEKELNVVVRNRPNRNRKTEENKEKITTAMRSNLIIKEKNVLAIIDLGVAVTDGKRIAFMGEVNIGIEVDDDSIIRIKAQVIDSSEKGFNQSLFHNIAKQDLILLLRLKIECQNPKPINHVAKVFWFLEYNNSKSQIPNLPKLQTVAEIQKWC
ncbi:hypothetical protein C1645_834548 [Glomus cerebriforme]|uniref:Uncharacterized protein n=1 Tax=Glomus cerebriforme TaxID=658196 RepID=A0A397SBT7_9GLOM|nr:hypothetical protein C1645_834548 [Glomus cerebriforme]